MAEGPVLTSRAGERQARLAFASYLPEDGYISEFTVTANADGLTATTPVITTPGDGYGLPGFIRELADDFRGWEGIRSWRSLEDQLRVEAAWRDGGHVSLHFHMTPSVYDKWSVTMNFTLKLEKNSVDLAKTLPRSCRADADLTSARTRGSRVNCGPFATLRRQTVPMEVSRAEVLEVIDRLLSGDMTREAASRWAGKRHVEEMADALVEEALDIVTLIDGRQISEDGELLGYLFDFVELEAMHSRLRESTG